MYNVKGIVKYKTTLFPSEEVKISYPFSMDQSYFIWPHLRSVISRSHRIGNGCPILFVGLMSIHTNVLKGASRPWGIPALKCLRR